jgi:hypothetical protein
VGGVLSPEMQTTRDALHDNYRGLVDNIADAKSQFEEGKISYAQLRNTVSNNQIQIQALDTQINEINKTIPSTKYERYQLPGGENYREILLTLPFKEPAMPKGYQVTPMQYDDGTIKYFAETPTSRSQGFRTKEEAQEQLLKTANNLKGFRETLESYKSSHFDEPNILAHMRVNDRIDADGKKMLLIEEVQSDWHQAGREKGYLGAETQKMNDAKKEWESLMLLKINNPQRFSTANGARLEELRPIISGQGRAVEGVTNAPFKDTWHQLALKRALKYAADNGYERVGLTTGKQQVERYANEMRQNVDRIDFEKSAVNFPVKLDTPNIQITASKNGKETFSGAVSRGKFIDGPAAGKTVEEVLGKSMAKQIAEHKQDVGAIKGDDLTIGGEGMKTYYDEIYPAFLDKQAKKWNSKTGETKIKTETSAPAYVDYIVGKGNFNDVTVLGLRADGSTVIINQNANSLQEAQQLANRYKEKHLGGGKESIRYIDITPEMKGGLAKGQPLHGLIAAPAVGLSEENRNKLKDMIK